MPLTAAAIIAALLLLAWAGVEVDHLVTAYPAESIFAVSAVAVIASAAVIARFRADHRPVQLGRPVRGTVLEAAPARPAIMPAPPAPVAAAGGKCDGPQCGEELDDDPWACEGTFPDTHTVSGRFHSKGCMEAWQRLMTERHSGRPSP